MRRTQIIVSNIFFVFIPYYLLLICALEKPLRDCDLFWIQLNLNSSNTGGSFTMANSNSVLNPYEILPIDQENKYLRKLSYFITYKPLYTANMYHVKPFLSKRHFIFHSVYS